METLAVGTTAIIGASVTTKAGCAVIKTTCSAVTSAVKDVKETFVAVANTWQEIESFGRKIKDIFNDPEKLKHYEEEMEDLKQIKDALTDLVGLDDSIKMPEELSKSIKEALKETDSLLEAHNTLSSKAKRNVLGYDSASEQLTKKKEELKKLHGRMKICLNLREQLTTSNKRSIESVLHPEKDDTGESIRKYTVLSTDKVVPFRLKYIIREADEKTAEYHDKIISVENKNSAENQKTEHKIRKNDYLNFPLNIYGALSRNHAVISAKKKFADDSLEKNEDDNSTEEYEFTLKNLNESNYTYYLDSEEQITNIVTEGPIVIKGPFKKLAKNEEVPLKNGDFIGLIIENETIMNFGFQFLENQDDV